MSSFSQIQPKSNFGKRPLVVKNRLTEESFDSQNGKRKRQETECETKTIDTDTKILKKHNGKSRELKELTVSKLDVFSIFGITHLSPYLVLKKAIKMPCSFNFFAGSSFISSSGNLSKVINNKCTKEIALKILKTKVQNWLTNIDERPNMMITIQKIFTELDDSMISIPQMRYDDFKQKIANNDAIRNENIREEFAWLSESNLRKFTLFRRLLQPIQRIMIDVIEQNKIMYHAPYQNIFETGIKTENFDVSFLDMLLGVDYLHAILAKALFTRLDQIETEYEKHPKLFANLRNLVLDHFDRLQPKIERCKQNEEFQKHLLSFLSTIKDDKCIVYCKLQPWLTDDRQKELQISKIDESKSSFDVIETIPNALQTTPTSVVDLPTETETRPKLKDEEEKKLKKVENNLFNKSKNQFWLNSLEPLMKNEIIRIRAEVKTIYEEAEQFQRNRSEYVQKRYRSSRRVTQKNRYEVMTFSFIYLLVFINYELKGRSCLLEKCII